MQNALKYPSSSGPPLIKPEGVSSPIRQGVNFSFRPTPPWLFKHLTDAALFSTSSFSDMQKIVEFIVTLLSGIQILDTGDMGDKISELAMMLKTSFQGFFDLPEDGEKSIPGSGIHSLQTATSDIFYECRSFCKIKQKLLNFIPPIISNIAGQELQIKEATDVISSSMQDYRWSFGIFLLMLHAVSSVAHLSTGAVASGGLTKKV